VPPGHEVHPSGRARINFSDIFAGRGIFGLEVYLVVLDRLQRATTKKGRQLFFRKKCTPDKILAKPMAET